LHWQLLSDGGCDLARPIISPVTGSFARASGAQQGTFGSGVPDILASPIRSSYPEN
jgi:hypothetical protein